MLSNSKPTQRGSLAGQLAPGVAIMVVANTLCWILAFGWANYVNDYVWSKGHTGWPGPPNWLPIPKEVYWNLNNYLACGCVLGGITGGLITLRGRRTVEVALAATLVALGAASGVALSLLTMIATF